MIKRPDDGERRRFLAAVAGLGTTVLAGCSSGGDGATSESDGTAPTTSETAGTTQPSTTTETVDARIEVESGKLRDAPLAPRLSGFPPDTRVRLTASATDANDRTWTSEAVFILSDETS